MIAKCVPIALAMMLAAVLVGGSPGIGYAGEDEPPVLTPPVNAGGGSGPSVPSIKLPDDWANPGTGGTGGYVPEPVPVGPSEPIEGVPVEPSTGTTGGYEPSDSGQDD